MSLCMAFGCFFSHVWLAPSISSSLKNCRLLKIWECQVRSAGWNRQGCPNMCCDCLLGFKLLRGPALSGCKSTSLIFKCGRAERNFVLYFDSVLMLESKLIVVPVTKTGFPFLSTIDINSIDPFLYCTLCHVQALP